MARIILSTCGIPNMRYFKVNNSLSIGRSPTNLVQLNDDSVGEKHAIIKEQTDDQGRRIYILQDLDSQHGCYLNAQRVKQQQLHHKDKIRIGVQEFIFFDYKDGISKLKHEKNSG